MRMTGKLYQVHACTTTGECNHSLMFMPLHDLDGIENIENVCNAPLNRLIEASFDGNRLVAYELSPITEMIDEGRKDIALIRYSATGLEEEERAKVEREAKRLEHYINRVNETHNYPWHFVQVTPYYLRTDDVRAGPAAMPSNLRAYGDQLRAQHPDRFDQHTYFHTWGGSVSGSALGLAGIDSPYSWSGIAGETSVIRHEQFHCFGCYHTSTPNQEYRGDRYCTMGNGGPSGVSMPQLGRIGLYDENHIDEAEPNQRYFLVPAEVNTADVRNGELKGLWVNSPSVATDWLLLSVRKSSYQSILGYGYGENTIFIDETRQAFGYNPTDRGSILTGQSRTIDGMTITNHGSKDGVVEVEVGSAVPSPYPQAAPAGEGDRLESQHSGIWNNSNYAHQGIFLVVGEQEIRGYWYTHNARGQANAGLMNLSPNLWFVLQGQADSNNVFQFDIHQMADNEDRVVGYGTMKLDGNEILMRSYTEAFGRESMRLNQLTDEPDGPVEVRANAPDEGYTMGKFGETYVAINFSTGYSFETPWTIYTGETPNQLDGYHIKGCAYKRHYTEKVKNETAIDFNEVRDNTELQFSNSSN